MDLNADLGEGFGSWSMGDDAALLDVVTSANVACGFHAGDPSIMRRVTGQAVERGVAIGAHVGYDDKPGFGRRFIDIEPDVLRDEVVYQLGALDAFARIAGDRVRYVKPHGALYNTIGTHEEQAAAVVGAIVDYDRSLPVLGLPGLGLAPARGGCRAHRRPRGFRGPRLHPCRCTRVPPASRLGVARRRGDRDPQYGDGCRRTDPGLRRRLAEARARLDLRARRHARAPSRSLGRSGSRWRERASH